MSKVKITIIKKFSPIDVFGHEVYSTSGTKITTCGTFEEGQEFVVEHIEKMRLEKVFNLIDSVSCETTKVYLNIPSPDTIKFLRKRKPALLQIIDNPVETADIIKNFEKIGFTPIYFNFYWYSLCYIYVKSLY